MGENTWQDASGRKWLKNQEKTDAQLGPLSESALEVLELRAGEVVLDVGCGTGQTLLELRKRVGETGRVVGLDISPPMLEGARARIAQSGANNIECVLADATTFRPEEPFDAIFSRFGMMFFEDMEGAFQNLLALLKPQGRMSFVCWQALEANPWAREPMAAIRRVSPLAPLPSMLREGEPGPFRFGDPLLVEKVLHSAGFRDVRVTPETRDMVLGGAQTLDEALEFALEIGPAARMVGEADPELMPQYRSSLKEALSLRLTPKGVVYPAALFVVTARVSGQGEERGRV